MGPVGKPRHPAINILLFVVTLGVYWFVWLWKAFGEVERARGASINKKAFLVPMIVLQAVLVGLAAFTVSQALPEAIAEIVEADREGREVDQARIDAVTQPLPAVVVAQGVIGLFFGAIQLGYLYRANELVRSMFTPGPTLPSTRLVIWFNGLFMLTSVLNVPTEFLEGAGAGLLRGLALLGSIAAYVIAIVWIVVVQRAMNWLWTGHQQQAPPSGWTPAPESPPR